MKNMEHTEIQAVVFDLDHTLYGRYRALSGIVKVDVNLTVT